MNLVIGFGNPLHSDDGVGPVVAGEAGRRFDVAVLAPHQLLPEHTDIVRRAMAVIFVDATFGTGETPGNVTCSQVKGAEFPSYDHQISPADLLALTRKAFGWEPKAWLITVAASTFEFGTQLSAPVAAAVPQVIELIQTILEPPAPPEPAP